MKKFSLLLLATLPAFSSFAQPLARPAIIPEPVILNMRNGSFILPQQVSLSVGDAASMKPVSDYLINRISTATGATVTLKNGADATATIQLSINTIPDPALGSEGYHLWVGNQTILLKANQVAGLFYGAQTLIQLFPKEIESMSLAHPALWQAPSVEIIDYPRLGWRGLMLDVTRHFFTKEEVKQYIDQMAHYKFNLLHLHLTDDEGWRIEIKSLPKLTSVGAYRVYKVGEFNTFSPPGPNEPRTYGGFFTQDDIRELVKYAGDRFINIMPEIDVPGHSLAAVASYPELSSSPEGTKFQVRSGEPLSVDNTLDPSNEKTYDFLDKVITEVAQLFPFGYVHLGGDECSKEYWKKSAAITALMKKENLKTYEEVQSYFEKRLEKIVEAKGKKFMGWDEIIEGGLGPNAAVMSWRGTQGGITAAKLGHEVVMAPTTFAYLDYMQSDAINEPYVYNSLRLNKTYQFEPVPDGVDAKLIRGGQANLWTEQVFNFRQVQYMTWPRAFAIAESVWSQKEKKNWDTFYPKVEQQFGRFDAAEIKYSTSMYTPIFDAALNTDGTMGITLSTEISDLEIHYSFDNSFPDQFYPKYTGTLMVPVDATQLRVVTYRGSQAMSRVLTMPIAELQRRINRKVNQ